MEVKEVIVVEGKNDTINIQKYIQAYIIETQGTHLSHETLELIKELNEKRGVIIFTDPDSPGESIRNRINQAIPGCKNAFLISKKAKGKGKVGIEHAKKEDILHALENCMTYEIGQDTLSWQEFLSLGLSANKDSKNLRDKIGRKLCIGEANAKTCFKRLNMLKINKQQLLEILREEDE